MLPSLTGYLDIPITRGDDFALPFDVGDETGAPLDLSGFTGFFAVSPGYVNPGTMESELAGSPIFVVPLMFLDATTGKCEIDVSAALTGALPDDVPLCHDVSFIDAHGLKAHLLAGNVTATERGA